MGRYSSAVYGPTGTKLGRKVGEGHRKNLAGPVSMATIMLSWQPKKNNVFMATSGLRLDIQLHVMSQSMTMLHFCQFVQVRVSWEPYWQCASIFNMAFSGFRPHHFSGFPQIFCGFSGFPGLFSAFPAFRQKYPKPSDRISHVEGVGVPLRGTAYNLVAGLKPLYTDVSCYADLTLYRSKPKKAQ